VIIAYVKSDAFKSLAPSTQAARRRILDHFADFKTPSGRPYGSNRIRTMLEPDVEAVLAGKPTTSKRDWLKAIRHWLAFAKEADEVDIDVTANIKTAKPAKSSGFVTWTESEIGLYRQYHANGTMARCGLELFLNTAARRGDVHLLGRQHLKVAWSGVRRRPVEAPARRYQYPCCPNWKRQSMHCHPPMN
jgi:hypothetical protein